MAQLNQHRHRLQWMYLAGSECCEIRSKFFTNDQVDSNQTEHSRLAHTALTVIITLHTPINHFTSPKITTFYTLHAIILPISFSMHGLWTRIIWLRSLTCTHESNLQLEPMGPNVTPFYCSWNVKLTTRRSLWTGLKNTKLTFGNYGSKFKLSMPISLSASKGYRVTILISKNAEYRVELKLQNWDTWDPTEFLGNLIHFFGSTNFRGRILKIFPYDFLNFTQQQIFHPTS